MNIVVGKFSQTQMHTTTEFVRCEDRLAELFCDSALEIKTVFAVADGCLQVNYQKKGESL